MDISQTLFLMQLTDGYSFRNAIAIIKSETEYATMIVSPKSIEISFLNTTKCAVHKIQLNTSDFAMYKYNIADENNSLYKEYPIAFDTNEMFNTTKGIGRKDSIRLYWLKGDNKINIQPIKNSAKDPGKAGALFVKILTIEHSRYDTGIYNSEPNVRVNSKDFADLCSQANSLRCTSLEIVGKQSAVSFKGIKSNQTVACINNFSSQIEAPRQQTNNYIDGLDSILENLKFSETNMESLSSGLSLNVVKSEDLMTVKVPISTVKALSKIHNISPPGTLLKIYFSEGKPTKIESPIGMYGIYIICLRSPAN